MLCTGRRFCSPSCARSRTRRRAGPSSLPRAGARQSAGARPWADTPSTACPLLRLRGQSVTHVPGKPCYLCLRKNMRARSTQARYGAMSRRSPPAGRRQTTEPQPVAESSVRRGKCPNKIRHFRSRLIRVRSTLPFSCPFRFLALFGRGRRRRRIEQAHFRGQKRGGQVRVAHGHRHRRVAEEFRDRP